jgi:hypothetical protein
MLSEMQTVLTCTTNIHEQLKNNPHFISLDHQNNISAVKFAEETGVDASGFFS